MTTSPAVSVTDELIAELESELKKHDGTDILLTDPELRALLAERAELKRDAERYRWLCDGNGYFMEENMLCHISNDKEDADAAIDAAMQP